MAIRGRRPKPRGDHALNGSLRTDRHGSDAETFAPTGIPERPAGLGEHGIALWDSVVKELADKGVATRIDSTSLGVMCEWYGRYRRFADTLDALPVENLAVYRLTTLAAICWKQYETLSNSFGLNPIARARLRIPEKTKSGIATRKRE